MLGLYWGIGWAKHAAKDERKRQQTRAESNPENMGFRIDSESNLYSEKTILFTILWPKYSDFESIRNRWELESTQPYNRHAAGMV